MWINNNISKFEFYEIMERIKKRFTREVFDGMVGIVLVLYAMVLLLMVISIEIQDPTYIFSYVSWLQIILALLIIYVSKERVRNIRW